MLVKLKAFDSFSTRSMFTVIEEKGVKIAIDPSISIAPNRFHLPPHQLELEELERGKRVIIDEMKDTDIIIITHYHWDHSPNPMDEYFESVFKNKIVFAKDFNNKVNKSQKNRGRMVFSRAKDLVEEWIVMDNKEYDVNGINLLFSKPVWHGKKNSPLGYVVMVEISGDEDVLFASDVQGPLSDLAKKEIIRMDPDILILSGVPLYLLGFKISRKDIETAKKNLVDIMSKTKVKKIVIDHHSSRSLNWREYYQDVIDISKEFGVNILSAAEFEGIEERYLEARRKELWKDTQIL